MGRVSREDQLTLKAMTDNEDKMAELQDQLHTLRAVNDALEALLAAKKQLKGKD